MFTSESTVEKLCLEDIMEERGPSEIKVSSDQKIEYKLGKCQTLRKKQCAKLKSKKTSWKLHNTHSSNNESIKISLWSKTNSLPNIYTNNNTNNNSIKYIPGNIEMYNKLNLSSIEWTRHETDLLFQLCNNFNNRWSIIIDRYNLCKPIGCNNRTIIELKQRYYECENIINKNNNNKFKYNPLRELKRREELNKLLMRTYDDNIEVLTTIESYSKHNKLLKKKINEMHNKKLQLKKQSHFIAKRQQKMNKNNSNNMNNKNEIGIEGYKGYGVTICDTFNNSSNNSNNILDLPMNCIPKKVNKQKRYIQMIDDEYTKYKYELKLDGNKTVIVPFPFIDKQSLIQQNKYEKNNKKKHSNSNIYENIKDENVLISNNLMIGKEIAKRVQKELVKNDIITVDKYTGQPRMYPMTNTTRHMVNVLREDCIKYYALQTMINDLKKKQKKK